MYGKSSLKNTLHQQDPSYHQGYKFAQNQTLNKFQKWSSSVLKV